MPAAAAPIDAGLPAQRGARGAHRGCAALQSASPMRKTSGTWGTEAGLPSLLPGSNLHNIRVTDFAAGDDRASFMA